jgi:hypothetical protein
VKTDRDRSIERLLHRAIESQEQPGPDCLDAETLAALVDAGLSAPERRAAESHVADCHRCQAVTAAIIQDSRASSADLSVHEAQSWWQTRRALNWLIPAMAGATAIALWVAIPGQRGGAPNQAERPNQAVAEPPGSAVAVPAQPNAAPVDTLLKATPPAREDNQVDVNAKEAATSSPSSLDAPPAAADASAESDQRLVGRQEGARDLLRDAAPAASSPPAEASASLSAARAALAPIAAAFEVTSPDPRYVWRIGPGALVQHSDDGGATWTTQETGAPGPWTAGSSPSPQVCWLVGPSGTVLRSSDGGRQWQPTSFPEAATDLVGVGAVNALTATVTLADGRRLSTSDGGLTWTPVGN